MTRYISFEKGRFQESFLIEANAVNWPNNYVFLVWSTADECAYRLSTNTVLEFHYVRTGTGVLSGMESGIPLDDIYLSQSEEHDYWVNQIAANKLQGYDGGSPPMCLEFASHLFANRRRQLMTRDRNIGMLVVCRDVHVVKDERYSGPYPFPHKIPTGD